MQISACAYVSLIDNSEYKPDGVNANLFESGDLSSGIGAAGISMLGNYDSLSIVNEAVTFDQPNFTKIASYTIQNSGDEGDNSDINDSSITAQFAFPYTGGLYWPEQCRIICDGADVEFGVSLGWGGDERSEAGDGGGDMEASNHVNESTRCTLYTVKATRGVEQADRVAHAYIGADFIVDVSRTRIIADGFGYAANPYGAVRIWSLSDGFDTGMERHLLIVGNDIDLNIKAFEDPGLTLGTSIIDVEIERQPLTIKNYLLMFSAPMALSKYSGRQTGGVPEKPPVISETSAIPTELLESMAGDGYAAEYVDSLTHQYTDALNELMEIHYFIPRGTIYEKAESRRTNALLFEITFLPNTTRTVEITLPYKNGRLE